MLIIHSQHFGVMYEHLKVVKCICLTFGIMLSQKLGNSEPSSPSLKKPPQSVVVKGSNSKFTEMER